MKLNYLTKIKPGQDGAVWGRYLFRFDGDGIGTAYDISDIRNGNVNRLCEFVLDKRDRIKPHSNAVVFSGVFFEDGDEFPLLYTNVYNNYAGSAEPRKGVCCVYRLRRRNNEFFTTLVQTVTVGFTEDPSLWKVSRTEDGERPFGNFVVDRENRRLYAFVIRNEAQGTSYFSIKLPDFTAGEPDEATGVRNVLLMPEDIESRFDGEYCRFLQGACFGNDRIYITEGFTDSAENPPAIRIINTRTGVGEFYFDLTRLGIRTEPEMIDFFGNLCCYGDTDGNLYSVDFNG